MGQLEKVTGAATGASMYGTRATLDIIGRDIAPELADLGNNETLYLRTDDFFDAADFKLQHPNASLEEKRAAAIAGFRNFAAANGIDVVSKNYDLNILYDRRNGIFVPYDINLQKDGKPLKLVMTPNKALNETNLDTYLGALSENPSLRFRNVGNVSFKALQTYMYAHEAGHIRGNHNEFGDDLGQESEADARAATFITGLQTKGILPADDTLRAVRDARTLAIGYIAAPPEKVVPQLSEDHDTGFVMGAGADAIINNIDFNEQTSAIAAFNNKVYAALGAAYRPAYDAIIHTPQDDLTDEDAAGMREAMRWTFDPEIKGHDAQADLRSTKASMGNLDRLVESYKPYDFNLAAVSAQRRAGTLDSEGNLMLGSRIAQTYPDIHQAMVAAMYKRGMFYDSDQDVQLQEKIAESFLTSYNRLVHPALIDKPLGEQMTRAFEGPISRYDVQNNGLRDDVLNDEPREEEDVEEPAEEPPVYGPTKTASPQPLSQ